MALGSEVGPSGVCAPSLVSLLCVSVELYPRKLDVRDHQCSDDNVYSDRRYFFRVVCISNEYAGLEQCAGASPVSIALTVLEVQLTKGKVSGASSYQVLFAKGVNFRKRLYLENGKCYEFRIWIGLLLKAYRFVRCTHRVHSLTLFRTRESERLFFYPNIDDLGHRLCEIIAL